MNSLPSNQLELRAAEERRKLQHTMVELKSTVRETLDVKRAAREYVKPASAVVAVLGLVVGYAFAGMFTKH
jgi:hypothetical protein